MENGQSSTPKSTTARRMILWITAAIVASRGDRTSRSGCCARPSRPASAPAPRPARPRRRPQPRRRRPLRLRRPEPLAANTTAYDASTLPQVDVFAVIAGAARRRRPVRRVHGREALAARQRALRCSPIRRASRSRYLPRDLQLRRHDGSDRREASSTGCSVLLVGRQAVPSQGNPAQVTGWLRAQDVEIAPVDAVVEVSISARTIDIVRGGSAGAHRDRLRLGRRRDAHPGRAHVHHDDARSCRSSGTRGAIRSSTWRCSRRRSTDSAGRMSRSPRSTTTTSVRGRSRTDASASTPQRSPGSRELPLGTPVVIRP